jgi:hypothetical protein
VAFSGVAMADTLEVKEIKKENKKKEVVLTVVDCYTSAANYVDNVYDPNGTHTSEQNNAIYQAYLAGCLAEKSITQA